MVSGAMTASASHAIVTQMPGPLAGQVRLLPTGLVIDGAMPFETWREIGIRLGKIQGAVLWWVGDWLEYGDREYEKGEKYDEALLQTGYSYTTLRHAAWVARQFPLCIRVHRVSWRHYHIAVARIDDSDERSIWLHRAEEDSWSSRALDRAIDEANNGSPWLCYTDVWNIPDCDERYGIAYPGRIPGQIVQNVLYYFAPGAALVVDPMAGGGVVIDVCREAGIQCVAFDLHPVRDDIRRHDAREPWPVRDADLVFIDPPYGSQRSDAYQGLAQADDFLAEWQRVLQHAYTALRPGGRVCVLMAPMAIKGPYIDLPFETVQLAQVCGFEIHRRVSVPVSSQQVGPSVVAACKASRTMVAVLRDLLVFDRRAVP